MDNMDHMRYLDRVTTNDLFSVREKEATYQGSWKKRGGVGTFMMLARKWDRIEGILRRRGLVGQYDIFTDLGDGSDGTLLAEVRDLRRYLLLVEAEVEARANQDRSALLNETMQHAGQPAPGRRAWDRSVPRHDPVNPGTPEDGGHHAYYAEHQADAGSDHHENVQRRADARLLKLHCDCPDSPTAPPCPNASAHPRPCYVWISRKHRRDGWEK